MSQGSYHRDNAHDRPHEIILSRAFFVERKILRSIVFTQSVTNGSRSLSRLKASTHSPSLAESRAAAHTLKHGASPLCCCAEYLIATTSCKKTAGGSECTPMACIPSSDAAAPPSCAALDIARRRGSFPVLAPNRDPVVNDERTAGHGDRSGIIHSMDRVPAPTSMIDAVLSSA